MEDKVLYVTAWVTCIVLMQIYDGYRGGNKNRFDLLPIFQSAIAKWTSTKSAEIIGQCTCSFKCK